MKLIIGLGNPGEKYISTRHNLGFMIIDHLLKDSAPVSETVWSSNTKLKSETAQITRRNEKVILAKPQTYMNNSGMAVRLLSDFYKVSSPDIWVIHDELDLPLGAMKIRFGGAAAGHHGVESIIDALGTDKFWRFRMGIGEMSSFGEKTKVRNAESFVLGMFSSHEQGELKKTIKRGTDSLQTALAEDIERAMNRFNTK